MPRGVLLLFLVLFLPTSSALADPIILITGGTLDVSKEGNLNLDIHGTRGFRLFEVGFTHNALGVPCLPCVSGEILDLGSTSGVVNDQAGLLEVDGMSFNIPGDADAPSQFFATAIVPTTGTSAVLSVPFTYRGSAFIYEPGLGFETRGHGTVTAHLRPDHGGPLWAFDGARYEFATTPIPEPSTLLLLSGGLAGLVWRRHARRRCVEVGPRA